MGSSLSVLAGALSATMVGRVVDRRGPRLPILAEALVGLGRQSHRM